VPARNFRNIKKVGQAWPRASRQLNPALAMCKEARTVTRGEAPLGKIIVSPGKTCRRKFKAIGHSSKIFAPLRKLFALLGVSSWLCA